MAIFSEIILKKNFSKYISIFRKYQKDAKGTILNNREPEGAKA